MDAERHVMEVLVIDDDLAAMAMPGDGDPIARRVGHTGDLDAVEPSSVQGDLDAHPAGLGVAPESDGVGDLEVGSGAGLSAVVPSEDGAEDVLLDDGEVVV